MIGLAHDGASFRMAKEGTSRRGRIAPAPSSSADHRSLPIHIGREKRSISHGSVDFSSIGRTPAYTIKSRSNFGHLRTDDASVRGSFASVRTDDASRRTDDASRRADDGSR